MLEYDYTEEETEGMKFLGRQWREIISTDPQEVTCGCGHKIPLRYAYKCLYCGIYFCWRCAEVHFGKTKAEYRQQRRQIYVYKWSNNEKRRELYGQRCRILARMKMNSALVRFENGQEEVISRNAIKREK